MAYESPIGNAIKMGLLLEFESAFPGETPLKPEQYLKGGRKSFVLNVAAFLKKIPRLKIQKQRGNTECLLWGP